MGKDKIIKVEVDILREKTTFAMIPKKSSLVESHFEKIFCLGVMLYSK